MSFMLCPFVKVDLQELGRAVGAKTWVNAGGPAPLAYHGGRLVRLMLALRMAHSQLRLVQDVGVGGQSSRARRGCREIR